MEEGPNHPLGKPQANLLDQVQNISFLRDKYGVELLIDVAWIHEMPQFVKSDIPYRLDFYDITLITSGQGYFCLDQYEYPVRPSTVLFTSPGQVRRWLVDGLDGLCFFFPAEFILHHFNDALFLHRLRYFHSDVGPFELTLQPDQQDRLGERLSTMHTEIADLKSDSPHLLRAIAYEVLINLNRWYAQSYGQTLDSAATNIVSRYRQAVEQNFRRVQKVADYANQLAVSPGHLNTLCRQHLGRSASKVLQDRIMAEAQRLLTHSQSDVGQIAERLGYLDASYFSRAFRRETGVPPRVYRNRERERMKLTALHG